MKVYSPFLSLLIIFLISSCSNALKPEDYVQWIDDASNGMIHEQSTDAKKITCKFTPAEYVVLKQFNPTEIDKEVYSQELDVISDMTHFVMRFENLDGFNFLKDNYTTQEEFQTKTLYLSYDIRTDLKLVQGEDTVVCALNHHERTYSNTPFEQILLAFPKPFNKSKDMTLIFDDRVFGFNRVKFYFSKADLESIPLIRID